jgi:hypothetical protein
MTGDGSTMGEAIALGAPTAGRMSKRARAAAMERLRRRLFGDGLKPAPLAQPSRREVLLRQAAELRDLAARGMKPRAYAKRAAELEAEAAAL